MMLEASSIEGYGGEVEECDIGDGGEGMLSECCVLVSLSTSECCVGVGVGRVSLSVAVGVALVSLSTGHGTAVAA